MNNEVYLMWDDNDTGDYVTKIFKSIPFKHINILDDFLLDKMKNSADCITSNDFSYTLLESEFNRYLELRSKLFSENEIPIQLYNTFPEAFISFSNGKVNFPNVIHLDELLRNGNDSTFGNVDTLGEILKNLRSQLNNSTLETLIVFEDITPEIRYDSIEDEFISIPTESFITTLSTLKEYYLKHNYDMNIYSDFTDKSNPNDLFLQIGNFVGPRTGYHRFSKVRG